MRRRPTVLLTAALVAALAALPACGSSKTAASPTAGAKTQVTVGVIPIIDVAPIYLGQTKGFFAQQGIELKLESGQGGAAIVPGVVSGQFQFGFSNVTSLLLARSRGLDLKIVTAGNYSTGKPGADFGGVIVKADSPIKSAHDLAGKTVAVNTLKNIGDTTVREAVRKAGGDPKAVKFVELAFPDMPAAVAGGRVDAAWVVEPFLTIGKSQGDRVVAWNFADTDPHLMIAAYFTSGRQEKQNPDLVRRFDTAMKQSLEYAAAHQDEARQVITTYTKIDSGMAAKLTLPLWSTDINKASVQRLSDLAVGDGLISTSPDVNALLP